MLSHRQRRKRHMVRNASTYDAHLTIANMRISHMLRAGGTSVAPPLLQSNRVCLPSNAAPEVLLQNVNSGQSVEVMVQHPGSPNPDQHAGDC